MKKIVVAICGFITIMCGKISAFAPQTDYGIPDPPEEWGVLRILKTLISFVVIPIVLIIGIVIFIKKRKK